MHQITGGNTNPQFLDIVGQWLSNKKQTVDNVLTVAVLRAIWKRRNDLCFNGTP